MMKLNELMNDLDRREGNAKYWKSEAEEYRRLYMAYKLEARAAANIIQLLTLAGVISPEARAAFYDMIDKERELIREHLV